MSRLTASSTLADVLKVIEGAGLPTDRVRDMTSAINRICVMAGTTPSLVPAHPPTLRLVVAKLNPAAHRLTSKSWSTMRSALSAALQLAGLIDDLGRGRAQHDSELGATHASSSARQEGSQRFGGLCELVLPRGHRSAHRR